MIKIIDGWYFKKDEFQYILIHEYQKEKGVFGKVGSSSGEMVTKQEDVGYFTSVEAMLRKLAEILVKAKIDEGVVQTIKDYLDEMENIVGELREMCRGY